jgi:hypothetical protein
MHCNSCGALLQPGDVFCPGCGRAVPTSIPAIQTAAAPPMYIASGEPSGKATASLICGVLFFIVPAALCAIIFGHLALSEIKRSGGRLIGEGRAIAGLVLGYIGLAGIPFILIIAAIAIPNLLRVRGAHPEASAVGSLHTIRSAEINYRLTYPEVGFACSLPQLSGNQNNPSSTNAGLIDQRLASGVKNQYRFSLVDCGAGAPPFTKYRVSASPIRPGMRTFCSDQDGEIRSTTGSVDECFDSGTPLR